MDYIQQLRQYIGHRPILMLGATTLVLNKDRHLLMMKRTDSGLWGVPGGAVELGEVVEDAAKRETWEETHLEIVTMSLFGVFSGPELYYKYPNGDEVYNVSVTYLSLNWRGDVSLNEEHSEWNWFAAGDIPIDFSPPLKPILEHFKRTIF
jgi:8-oxo-dGTP pyrophosphatase MutT (NUDIX family)